MGFVATTPIGAADLAPATLGAVVDATIAAHPDRAALLAPGLGLTYRELGTRSHELATGLAKIGVGRGDVVAAQLPNGPDFVALYLAVTRCGAALQTLHMPYRAAELGDLLAQSGATLGVGLAAFKGERPAATMLAARPRCPGLRAVASVGGETPGALAFESLATSGSRVDDAARPDDPMLLLYTSGTTASPKGVPNRHAGFLANARASSREFEMSADDVVLAVAPFTHLYGAFALHLALVSGAASALLPAFSPDALARTARETGATLIFAAPAHFAALFAGNGVRSEDFGTARTICLSGSPVAPELARQIEAALPRVRVVQLWGMSELQAGSYGRPGDPTDLRHFSAGRPSPGTELRIVDESGAPLDAGEDGRLQARGPSLFAGYRDNPEATAQAFTPDGWFETGDTGHLRPDGALVLTGRVKEIINRGGIKFSPVDVELAIERMAGVGRAAIVPMPDPVLGERAALFVVPVAPATPSLDEVTAHLEAAGIAKFKWPERIELIGEMPLTPTQKIMRGRLAQILAERSQDAA